MSLPSYAKTLEKLSARGHFNGYLDVFQRFTTMAACSLAPPAGDGKTSREDEYAAEVARLQDGEPAIMAEAFRLLVEEMEAEPYTDLLGAVYQEWQSVGSQQSSGQFFTPTELCRLMARMTIDPEIFRTNPGPVMFQEPACGSGRTILAAAEYMKDLDIPPCHMRALCIDVSKTACDMCFVNLTLHGIPAQVVHGNTLSLKQDASHRNLFWYGAYGYGPQLSDRVQAQSAPERKIGKQLDMMAAFEGQGSFAL